MDGWIPSGEAWLFKDQPNVLGERRRIGLLGADARRRIRTTAKQLVPSDSSSMIYLRVEKDIFGQEREIDWVQSCVVSN